MIADTGYNTKSTCPMSWPFGLNIGWLKFIALPMAMVGTRV